jgi:hypothetical protein
MRQFSRFRKLGLNSEVVNRQKAYADPMFSMNWRLAKQLPELFRKQVRRILNNPEATDRQIDDSWCAMIRDIPAKRVELLKVLSKNLRCIPVQQYECNSHRIAFTLNFREISTELNFLPFL